MGQRIVCLIMILLLSHLPIIESASAQWAPAIDLECQAINPSGNLEINITADSNKSDYADCTVSNPSMYQETIKISVNSGLLASAAPGEIIIAANSEVDFQVTVLAETTMLNQTIELMIIAEVVEVNGLPWANSESSESNLLVDITLHEEANETGNVIVEKSDDQSLVYAASGGAVLLLLILFVVMKRRK
tara:strand:- start:640 stop:1209 length:570 start_codon:yes stop_codon:yes gene_type:complete